MFSEDEAAVSQIALSAEERGFILAMTLLEPGEGGVAGLEEPARAHCRAAFATLAAASKHDAAALLDGWRAQALAEIPDGLATLHPSWLRSAFAGEPAEIILALVTDLPAEVQEVARAVCREQGADPAAQVPLQMPGPLLADLQRAVFAPLGVLTAVARGPLGTTLCGLCSADLVGEIPRWGAKVVGQSLFGAPRDVQVRAAALIGDPWAEFMLAATRSNPTVETRARARRHVAEASRHATANQSSDEKIRQVGLLALREALSEEQGSLAAVAGRLPMAWGTRLLASG